MSQRLNLAVLSLVAITGVASAQLVTPPTDAPPKTEPLPLPPQDSYLAPASKQPTPTPTITRKVEDIIPPDLKWEKLAKMDAKGNLIRLHVPPEAAAITVNPLLNNETRSLANAYLAERRKEFENLVISNLDIAEDLDSDKLAKINVADRDSLKWLKDAMKPFSQPVAPGTISNELIKKGVFSPVQAKVNAKIAKEYSDESLKDAVKAAEAAAGGSMTKIQQVPIILREQAVGETLDIRRDLMIEAGNHLAAILPKLKLQGDVAAQAQAVAKKVAAATTDDQKFKEMEALRSILTIDERREMLKAALAERPVGR